MTDRAAMFRGPAEVYDRFVGRYSTQLADAMCVFWEAAAALDPEGATPLMEAHTMRFARPEELAALWRSAGLEGVDVVPILVEASYDDFDDLWSPFPTGVGPAGAYTASLDGPAQTALRDEYARRLGDPRGAFTLSARAWCSVGFRS